MKIINRYTNTLALDGGAAVKRLVAGDGLPVSAGVPGHALAMDGGGAMIVRVIGIVLFACAVLNVLILLLRLVGAAR